MADDDAPTTHYYLIWDHDFAELQARVNRAIANGWRPLGGVGISESRDSRVPVGMPNDTFTMCQAMISPALDAGTRPDNRPLAAT